jgi:hypothetical protein
VLVWVYQLGKRNDRGINYKVGLFKGVEVLITKKKYYIWILGYFGKGYVAIMA